LAKNAGPGFQMSKRRTKFTPVVIEQIPRLLEQGRSPVEIADRIGCTINTLRVRCSQLRISLRHTRHETEESQTAKQKVRQLTVCVSPKTFDALRQQAALEGMSGSQLAAHLLDTIVRDCLYKAVLDRE
jgi:hypothetical protein